MLERNSGKPEACTEGALVRWRQKGWARLPTHTCSKGLLFCTPLAPTNTQLSRKARSFTFLLPRSLKSFLVSSFILPHRRKTYKPSPWEAEVEAGRSNHLLGGWVIVGCDEYQGAFMQRPNKLQQVVHICGDRSHETWSIRHHAVPVPH